MRTLLIVAGIVAFVSAAVAQDQKARTVPPNTVAVSADGRFQVEPDTALIQFTVSTSDKSAKITYDRAAKAVEQVRETLRSSGIDPAAAQFGSFSLVPIYDYRGNGKRKIVQYTVNTSVHLRLKQFDKVGPLLDQLSALDITGDQTLNYVVEDTEAGKAKAVQDGMARAKAEAEAIARGANRTLGPLVWASVDTQEFVPSVAQLQTINGSVAMSEGIFGAHKAAPPPPPPPSEGFTPGSVTITAQINAVFALN